MKQNKILNIKGALLEQDQLQSYFEKMASEHVLQKRSDKKTYPILRLDDNFKQITRTFDILNSSLKRGITIHPAGEWILDNYYAIEETYKTIKKEFTLKKYINFVGIASGEYKGFARIYVLSSEIVAYTDGKIDNNKIVNLLKAYQKRKILDMEEIWHISIFINIALIEQIRNTCEKIYFSQMQKYKVENIIERLVENKENRDWVYKKDLDNVKLIFSKEPFVEYLSFRLNQYGKKGMPYIRILNEQIERTGTTISEIIKKEHFDIAIKKLSIGNCIKSIKDIQRINFTEIFEQINRVEEILKKDPAKVYENMTYKSKEYYRNQIKEIANKNKMSELYITRKALELANNNKDDINIKKSHIGYYIIDKGIYELKKELNLKLKQRKNGRTYIFYNIILTSFSSLLLSFIYLNITKSIISTIAFLFFSYIPISEILFKINQYILSKIVKPKMIPRIDFSKGIPNECTTMVIVPTILTSKEDVKEMLRKLEVYYWANKSQNLHFTLLGDCTTSTREKEEYDIEIIQTGEKIIKELNQKYSNSTNIFNFVYRKRIWNSKENNFLGWERKRGLITEFNSFLLGNKQNTFIYNSIENENIPKIKYIITLDSDTSLVLESAKELIGAMAHILNKPIIDEKKNIVIEGYGILQPRIGIDINSSRKTLFTKIYTGMGGVDAYSNAISDVYQDNFGEGIYTGKGIYDLKVFHKVLENAIPDNTILSHDLIEGIYARCGLISDVVLLDSYPSKFSSFINRKSRWIRGDWQIIVWLKNKIKNRNEEAVENPINELGKFKILDNLRRSLLEITQIICLLILFIKSKYNLEIFYVLIFLSVFIDLFIDVLDTIIFKKEGVKKQSSFENKLPGLKLSIVRNLIDFSSIIYKAVIFIDAIVKTLYRLKKKQHLLEWVTAAEEERKDKESCSSYFKEMWINVIIGIIVLIIAIEKSSICQLIISILWITSPFVCAYISKSIKVKNKVKELNDNELEEIIDCAQKTWGFFQDFINKENNFLPIDNYQESRIPKIVNRTSSTNIGLALISIISAYDLKFIEIDEALNLIINMLNTIKRLPKWNGHLYNWYNIKTLETLKPEYISTVDSGNFVGCLIILKDFLKSIDNNEIKEKFLIKDNIKYIDKLIKNTDFSKLYNNSISLFSIGFNVDENKLTDSYYDLLASEARQASLVAIAKKDVPSKHWNHLSRTLTYMDGKKGLLSWSGTAFEYLMPNINIKEYKGSLLEESCKFMIMSQKKYCKKLEIPWGISEAAFNLKDFNSNYQYKAFGIPWLGLKRGLENDVVVSSYGGILAITKDTKDVMKNMKILKSYNAYGKYGFYESIDFTPDRLRSNKKYEVVKTYMAHHQALILLSINNLINDNILQRRFHNNPEIKAVDILIQEKMPEDMIITKEKKEKVEKIKYNGYDARYNIKIESFDNILPYSNTISNGDYTIFYNKDGKGFSKYKNILINRYKYTNSYDEGIAFYFKNLRNNRIWSSFSRKDDTYNYKTVFTPDMNETFIKRGNITSQIKTIISSIDNVEIRNVKIKNTGEKEEKIEISSVLEPLLSEAKQDYSHKAFNNLFLKYEKIENGILIKRNKRGNSKDIYLGIGFFSNKNDDKNIEYEIDKEKLYGRLNSFIPKKIKTSDNFTNEIGLVTNPILAFRRKLKILPKEDCEINLILSVSEDREEVIKKLEEYKNFEYVKKNFEISRIRNEENAKYLGITANEMLIYQKILTYVLTLNPLRKIYINKFKNEKFKQNDLWKYGISGDYPIILLKISAINEIQVLKELLKAYKYFQSKNITIDLVILNKEKNTNERNINEEINKEIANYNLLYLINYKIFIINCNNIDETNKEIFDFKAGIIIEANRGKLENIILELEEEYIQMNSKISCIEEYKEEKDFQKYEVENLDLKYKNSYGGFTEDEREYVICVDEKVPSAWSNILSNENFGTIVTQNLGGYSWYKNSRLNRISKWSNDEVFDIPSEYIYVQDEDTKKFWRIGQGNLKVTHGFGYSKYEQNKLDIKQELEVFVSMNDNVKINLLTLRNNTNRKKKINLIYKIDNVLDEDEIDSNGNIELKYEENKDILYSRNIYQSHIDCFAYMYSSERIESYTGNSDSINLYSKWKLNLENSLGNKSCMALQISIELNAFEEKKISFILGAEDKIEDFKLNYKSLDKCDFEYKNIIKYWDDLLNKVRVKTPEESINIMLNGWTMYQTIASRIYARSGFYQSGGAFGFRDQLQDTIGIMMLNSDIAKKQIIKHAKHQFIEGDVEHWWHEEISRGIRTKFSDDRLWLVYVVIIYIRNTGDKEILDIEIPYVEGEILKNEKDEDYNIHLLSSYKETLYEHCKKAIDISIKFGENNLPLIGSGDWNDGFSEVGNKGKGESVWLGFFLYDIIKDFIEIIKEKEKDNKIIIDKYEMNLKILKNSLNNNGWDGQWYRRAYTDEGKVLGSEENSECRIDSIAQSWSVISNAGDKDKRYKAMESLEKYLIDEEKQIIKLLDPPFEKGNLNPGYIQAYLPGVRENGGQYTHGAVWVIIAFAKLKEKNKALKYFKMINPIEHSDTKEKADKYKVEPYVISADVYGSENLIRKRRMELVYRFIKLVLCCRNKVYFRIKYRE